jgi:hypothetical protein
MRAYDKASIQSRRPLESVSNDIPLEKNKFGVGKFLKFKKFKPTISKERLSPRVLVVNKRRAMISAAVFGIVVIAGGAFGYYEYLVSQSPAVIYVKKLKSITDTVGKQISLPTDEQPVVATVTDTKVLPKEAFFQNAQIGDKILMYKKDKKAILYRPGTGQVITIAVLDFKDVITPTPSPQSAIGTVAGASTSAAVRTTVISQIPTPVPTVANYVPQGKILIQPQQ